MSRDSARDVHRNRNNARGSRNTHDDVQRAIEGLKDIPDDELQDFLDDEDFNIVDTWEGDEDHLDDIGANRHARERDSRRHSRDRNRRERHRGSSINRDRSRRDERKREDLRRDPSKSSKDIERDKIRTKRDNQNKILAEKEKAIKNLLDSDTIVPPGTEVEAIETERLIMDRGHRKLSRERRRTQERHRSSPTRRRSHDRIRFSPFHRERSPLIISPERRRSLDRRRSSERRRRASWDRRISAERREKRSSERMRRRMEERDIRIVVRRSRSRERHRSRSTDRLKRKWSRSPGRRGSPRRRTFSKSPDRRRKRSPFINEIARQFRDEALMNNANTVNQFIQPPALINPPMHQPGPPANYIPMMDPVGPMGMPGPGQTPFMPFDPAQQPMNFEPMPMHPLPHDYNAPPVIYNQGNPINPIQSQFGLLSVPSPQPVPAPMSIEPPLYNHPTGGIIQQRSPSPVRSKYSDSGHYDRDQERHRTSSYNGGSHSSRPDRLKTPEPPVISNPKPFEKTSLSSLLEASVSSKDSGYPVLYPGFKPEILRNCEMALRNLPDEDPRLKMPGRFFYDSSKEEPIIEKHEFVSNSILVQKTRNKINWEDEIPKKRTSTKPDMYQKYTQTETEMEEKCTQTVIETLDFCVQVCPGDLQPSPPPREEKRPIMDRLDWSVRETYDYSSGARDISDLRWSLSNSRWNRISPTIQERDNRTRSPDRIHQDRDSRSFDISPIRSRDNFSQSSRGNNYGSRDRFSPNYRRSIERQDNYPDNRSDPCSRDASPVVIDGDDDVEILEQESFTRESNWRGRGKSFSSSTKSRGTRGKYSSGGRSFRGRNSGFRGKF